MFTALHNQVAHALVKHCTSHAQAVQTIKPHMGTLQALARSTHKRWAEGGAPRVIVNWVMPQLKGE